MEILSGNPKNFTYHLGYAKGKHGQRYAIRNPIFPGRPEFSSKLKEGALSTGRVLELRRGFGFNMEPPYPSFKTMRAGYNAGLGYMIEDVVNNRKRSWVTNDYIWDGILAFSYPSRPKVDCAVYRAVLKSIELEFQVDDKIHPYSYGLSRSKVPRQTSPGLPYIQMGYKTKDEVLSAHYTDFIEKWTRCGEGQNIDLPPCAAFARSHIGDLDSNKVRPVWAVPVEVILQEGCYSFPFTNELIKQSCGHHTAYGMEMMKGGMEWLHNQCMKANAANPGIKYLMLDYSAFDSSTPAWLIRDVFKIIEKKFDFTKVLNEDGSYSEANPTAERRKFRKLVSYFINTVILNPDGRTFQKNKGIPSGSMFTNLVGTILNMIVSRVALHYKVGSYPLFDLYFGDDSLSVFKGSSIINLEDIAEFIERRFGMTVNVKKSYWTELITNIHFLGYYNNRGNPKKHDYELISSMIYPQYNKDDWAYSIARALGCLLASGGQNPNIFHIARMVYHMASQSTEGDAKVEEGVSLINDNPRMKRHLNVMGCGDINVDCSYFSDYTLSQPRSDCTKMNKCIEIWNGISNN